ncbi:MAG TPA: YafY family protein [Bryobacteraceae bacterium]|nr:YafY family protein [Bryobacteraceae bacterium]
MRADRLLSILLLLQVNRRMTARELSRRLEVSERTILRDMDALSGSGVPVMAERGSGGGWSLMEEYQTKLTGLSTAEIQSLFLGKPPKLMADLGLRKESEAAWIKLQASLPSHVREQAEFVRQRILIDTRGWRDPGESVQCLPVLLDALWRERRIRFVYERTLGETGERVGDPLGLVARGSVWYLIARIDADPRTYRVSRIRDVAILEETSTRPSGFELAAWWEQSATDFREKLPRYYATFLADPSLMPWIRYRGWRLEEEKPDGDRIRIRLRFDAEEEALQFVLSFGGRVDIVEPAELCPKVLAGARAIVERFERA